MDQEWLTAQQPDLDRLFTPDFICRLHREFYQRVPESLWVIKDEQGKVVDKVIPGEWRARSVIVGQYIPPEAEDLAPLMAKFCETYNPKKIQRRPENYCAYGGTPSLCVDSPVY